MTFVIVLVPGGWRALHRISSLAYEQEQNMLISVDGKGQ